MTDCISDLIKDIINNGIVRIKADGWGEYWDVTFNLAYICSTEGKKVLVEKDPKRYEVELARSQVRQIFKFIIKHGTDEQIELVQSYLNQNSKTFGKLFSSLQKKKTVGDSPCFTRVM